MNVVVATHRADLAIAEEAGGRDLAEMLGEGACVVIADLDLGDGSRRHELAGPDRLTYDELARLIARAAGHERPLLHVPLGAVRTGLVWLRRVAGDAAFATWEEAELMEVPMVSERGTADAEALGVKPRRMADVLEGS